MFLSQPPMANRPSKPWQPATVSMESAMTSRDTSEYFMASVPLAIPSEMVIVLKMTALLPFRSTPSAASSARPLMCMLQGVTMLQVEAIPIWGFWKSASEKPTARSMARAGAFLMPSTMGLEWRRGSSWLIGNLGERIGPVYGGLIGHKGKAIAGEGVQRQAECSSLSRKCYAFQRKARVWHCEGMAMIVPSRVARKTGTDRGETRR